MAKDIQFRVSSALKNLIGQELITDEFIAIFELVKNSFDARATKVVIRFENTADRSKSKITIVDDGKGMSYSDLIDKWLFVAYSAKKDDTEDSGEYRDKINQRKFFAGAKGVGRFSCDRLGNKLNLVTVQNSKSAKIENLVVDWEDFEKDAKKEFANVDVKHQTLKSNPFKFKHGTVLEITGLRDDWNRTRLLKLKQSLAKLINPNKDNDTSSFSIHIEAPEQKSADSGQKEARERVNGPVTNFVFEKLGLKTTQIMSEISADGKHITTTLSDRGRLIYKITEHNKFKGILRDIKIHLFQLNKEAKRSFTLAMGMEAVKYGSVFLYKNGFRIYPFGDEGEDIFGVNRRKQQGYNRFLGTRDLIGRIEINGKNDDLKETTSRDGGLIKNASYHALEDFFIEYALKRLEKYVVDVIRWGDARLSGEKLLSPALNPEDVKPEIAEIIATLSNSDGIVDFEYDKKFLDFLSESQAQSLPKMVKNFQRIAEESGNKALEKEARSMASRVEELLAAKSEAEKGQDAAQKQAKAAEQRLEEEVSENLFAKSALTTDMKDVIALQHQIDHSTDRIKRNVDSLLAAISKKAPKKEILGYIERISLEANKISSISQFVTKANFNLKSAEISADLVSFVKEYVENVYREYPTTRINRPHVKFRVATGGIKFGWKFRPLEMIIMIDNLFSNSFKAGARNIQISFEMTDSGLRMIVKDDGTGIAKNIAGKVFNLGFTTTKGSGIGLYHVKQVVERMGGTVTVGKMSEKGAVIVIELKK